MYVQKRVMYVQSCCFFANLNLLLFLLFSLSLSSVSKRPTVCSLLSVVLLNSEGNKVCITISVQ